MCWSNVLLFVWLFLSKHPKTDAVSLPFEFLVLMGHVLLLLKRKESPVVDGAGGFEHLRISLHLLSPTNTFETFCSQDPRIWRHVGFVQKHWETWHVPLLCLRRPRSTFYFFRRLYKQFGVWRAVSTPGISSTDRGVRVRIGVGFRRTQDIKSSHLFPGFLQSWIFGLSHSSVVSRGSVQAIYSMMIS